MGKLSVIEFGVAFVSLVGVTVRVIVTGDIDVAVMIDVVTTKLVTLYVLVTLNTDDVTLTIAVLVAVLVAVLCENELFYGSKDCLRLDHVP